MQHQQELPVIEKIKQIRMKKSTVCSVPDLLLAYTYFLNEQHTCYINVGYNIDDFTLNVCLYKNGVFHILYFGEWSLLNANMITIKHHISSEDTGIEYIELPKLDTSTISFKLSHRKFEKCLIISGTNSKKIILNVKECEKLCELIPYLTSMVNWYAVTGNEIKNFYRQYLERCIERGLFKLSWTDFFLTDQQTGFTYYNYSRLFNEIPVLCKNKIIFDYNK